MKHKSGDVEWFSYSFCDIGSTFGFAVAPIEHDSSMASSTLARKTLSTGGFSPKQYSLISYTFWRSYRNSSMRIQRTISTSCLLLFLTWSQAECMFALTSDVKELIIYAFAFGFKTLWTPFRYRPMLTKRWKLIGSSRPCPPLGFNVARYDACPRYSPPHYKFSGIPYLKVNSGIISLYRSITY